MSLRRAAPVPPAPERGGPARPPAPARGAGVDLREPAAISGPALLAVLALSSAAFAALAVAVERGGAVVRLDRRVAEWVASDMPAWAEWAARPFSWLGGWIGITLITAVLLGELVRRRRWATALLVIGVLTGAQLLSAFLKVVFDRPRPDAGSAVSLPGSSAFPSGHATSASAFFGLLTLFAVAAAPSERARWAVGAAGTAVVLAIAASRVVLNVHYVSDVLAGLALGAAWLAACLLVAGRRRSEPGPPEDPARSRHEGVTHP